MTDPIRPASLVLAAGLASVFAAAPAMAQSTVFNRPNRAKASTQSTTQETSNQVVNTQTAGSASTNAQPDQINPYLTANCTSWDTEATLTSNGQASIDNVESNSAAPIANNSGSNNFNNGFGSNSIKIQQAAAPTTRTTRPQRTAPTFNHPVNMFGEMPSTGFTSGEQATANVRRVSFADVGSDFDPSVSRDGTTVVFASTQHRATADLYIKDAYGKTVTRLTNHPGQDVMPTLSPAGDYVAFCSDREGTWDLYVMPTAGGNAVRLTHENTHDLHPSWSPDGTRIAFSRMGEVSGQWELWVMDIASPAGLQFIGYGMFPEWSPVGGTGQDGTDRIAFQRSRERGDREFSIWTVDYSSVNGSLGRETEVVASTEQALINPSWSPDGEFLLYAAVDSVSSAGQPESSSLWMIGSDGRGAVQFVGGSSVDLMPTWGANNHVFFVSDRSGSENVWAIEVGTSVQTANVQRLGAIESPFANVETEPTDFGGSN